MNDLHAPPADMAPRLSAERTDAVLLQAWAGQGRSEDFTELVRRHIGLVKGTASRQVGDEHADDLAQAVFAILARKAASLRGVRSLSGWLHRVTVLQCRNAVRRLIRERRSQQAAMEYAILSSARDPLAEALPHLDSAILALGESDRELILLRYSEGLTFAQAAHRTGRSEAALRQQAGRALETLAGQLRRRGVAVPAAALATGLGQVLGGAGSAEAAAVCGTAALAAAQKLSAGTLAGITFSTMSTIQSIFAGSAAALLLIGGPVLWRVQQIREETAAAARPVALSPASAPVSKTPPRDVGKKPVPAPAPAVSTAAAAGGGDQGAPEDLLNELENLMNEEMMASFSEWARVRAWLEARRTGRMLALPAEKERELRNFVEAKLMERIRKENSDEGTGEHQDRRDYEAKLDAWYAENLTPEQNAERQRAAQSRKEALVERLAEDALHGISASIPLTEEQKTKLYDAAAAKAAKQLAENDYGGSLSFGAAISTPPAPPLEEAAADVIGSVLDPAQAELWDQAREQDRLLNDVFPRRLADRTLNTIRERGLGAAVMSLLRGALSGQ